MPIDMNLSTSSLLKPFIAGWFIFSFSALWGQLPPDNSDCGLAELLCAGTPTGDNFENALPADSIACFNPNASRWYYFTTNEIENESVTVTIKVDNNCTENYGIQGLMLQEILPDPCEDPVNRFDPISICTDSNIGDTILSITTQQILPNTTYWVLIDAKQNGDGDITACDFTVSINGKHVQPQIEGPSQVLAGEQVDLMGFGIDTLGYSWSPSNLMTGTNSLTPIVNMGEEDQTITLTGRIGECTGLSTEHTIVVKADPFKPPNVFSPNNDGSHDTWVIPDFQWFPNGVLEVFSRWGQRVFISIGYRSAWDGTRNGKPLPEGTYYWVMKYNRSDLEIGETKTGYVTILR